MKLARMLASAVIVLAIVWLLTAVLRRPAFQVLFGYLLVGGGVPFATSMAASLHAQHGIAILVGVLTILTIIPCPMADVARALVPIGIGMLAGTGLHRVMHEAKENA